MSSRLFSYFLVGVQFACLIYLALSGPVAARPPVWLALEIAGFLLGLWAVAAMRLGCFNITPEVPANGWLVQRGPYQIVRHPMYAAILLIGLALVGSAPTALRWLALALLAANLLIKLLYEERLLRSAFPAYAAYQRRTKRLIPFIF